MAGGGLGRESGWAAFSAGLMVIAGNPKAILFYMGVLPGFFDFRRLTPLDMALICLVSVLVPFLGNLGWAALFARARRWLAEPGGDEADACGGRGGAGGGGGGDCGGVSGYLAGASNRGRLVITRKREEFILTITVKSTKDAVGQGWAMLTPRMPDQVIEDETER